MKTLFGEHLAILLLVMCLCTTQAHEPAFFGAEGFGATSRGGTGGQTIRVKSLDDDPTNVQPGTLRWAIQQKGPRIVQFAVAGNIRLKAPLRVTEPFLTLDGSSAPAGGVCICDHSFECRRTHDIVVRYLRFRHGDIETLRSVEAAGLTRPMGSGDLDCVSLDDSQEIIFDHCSLSWSCDEIFGIVRCQNLTIQWCLLAEPLANPRIHPYGDRHAFGLNLSASTLSLHHCLLAHYHMRGPQFEANDVRRNLGYDVQMEAVNNVLFDYERSGSRYTTGIEDDPEEAVGTTFQFQFLHNFYVNRDSSKPEIEAVLKHGVIEGLKIHVSGNVGPHRQSDEDDQLTGVFTDTKLAIHNAAPEVRRQIDSQRLFAAPVPVTIDTARVAYQRVLAEAGCSRRRDAVDERILNDIRDRRFGVILKSQEDAGGWPKLD
jgi:hypothetical protein